MQRLIGFWIIFNLFVLTFLLFPSLALGYSWPIGDGGTQKRINGTFGEFRPPSGQNPPYNTNHFHDGVDIHGPQGTRVWGVQEEAVWTISSTRHYVITDYHDFRHIIPNSSLYPDTLINPYVILGWTDSENHLHFTQEDYRTDYGFEYNPLVQSFSTHLEPFEDYRAPIIEYVKLVDHETQLEFPDDTIRGNVDIIVKASDRTSYPGGVDYNNGIFGVGYAIQSSGYPWRYNIQFDFWPWVQGWNINCVYADSSDIDDYYYVATNKMNADTFWDSRDVYDGWWMIKIDVYDQSFNSRSYYLPVYVHNYLPYIYGDINLNGIPYESGDVILLLRAIVFGPTAVFWNYDEQWVASDVNRDGRPCMIADLVFLIKIIENPILPRIWGPFPKLAPTSQTVDFIVKRDTSKIHVSANSAVSLSAALLVFEHNGVIDTPELLCSNKMQLMWGDNNGELRILIWSPNGEMISSGEVELFSFTCSGEMSLISVEAVDSEIRNRKTNIIQNNTNIYPSEFALCQNYPNPFNPETEIKYTLAKGKRVKLVIYNMLGQRVKTLVDGYQTAGNKLTHWDGKDENGDEVGSGIYFYKIQAGDFRASKKMVLLR